MKVDINNFIKIIKRYFFVGLLGFLCSCIAGYIELPQVYNNSHIPRFKKIVHIDPPKCANELEIKIIDSLGLQLNNKEYSQINKSEKAMYFTSQKNNYDSKKKKFIGTDFLVIFNDQCKIVEIISYKYQ